MKEPKIELGMQSRALKKDWGFLASAYEGNALSTESLGIEGISGTGGRGRTKSNP